MENISEKEVLDHMAEKVSGEKTKSGTVLHTEDKKLYSAFKRVFDIVCSLLALVVLSPIFLFIAIAIKIEDRGSAMFQQERVGKNGKLFNIYKFRTMCQNAEDMLAALCALNERDGPSFKIEDDPRVTKIGGFLRKTCLDELPQLLNILKGDMSIVGPRPHQMSEVSQYKDEQKQRLSVQPGLTCIWQVNKGKFVTFDELIEMDLEYIRNRSVWLDIKLIFKTVAVVLSGKGAK